MDELRGLRAAITGDPISFEAKNKMPIQEPCKAGFMFNTNEPPNIAGQMKASLSRWGIVPFNKTYSLNPQADELQADPRFKEDPSFVQDQILPAFLNRLLRQLQAVVLEGIDYSPTQDAFQEMQRESSHLLQFAHDVGLQHDPTGVVVVSDLWERLRQWYIETGTLIVEKSSTGNEKLSWNEQPRRGDKNIKGSNQVLQRFLEIFPKARRGKTPKGDGKSYVSVITGIKYCSEIALGKNAENTEDKTLQLPRPDDELPSDWPRTALGLASENQISLLSADGAIKSSEASFNISEASPRPDDELPSEAGMLNAKEVQPSTRGHRGHRGQFSNNILFSAGDSVRYVGSDRDFRNLRGSGEILIVESINCQTAKVRHVNWSVSQRVQLADLEVFQ